MACNSTKIIDWYLAVQGLLGRKKNNYLVPVQKTRKTRNVELVLLLSSSYVSSDQDSSRWIGLEIHILIQILQEYSNKCGPKGNWYLQTNGKYGHC